MLDFALNEVLVTNEYYHNALQKEINYLISFDIDRLLSGFRITAGLDTKGAKPYAGWEEMLIGGHCVGHYLTACAQGYKNAGTKTHDREKLYGIMTVLCDGLRECQKNSKGKKGYLFGAQMLPGKSAEFQFDNVEANKTNIVTEAWVPWYTMHKIIAGLVDVYRLAEIEVAKVVASELGDWVYHRCSQWTKEVQTTVLNIEYGGMNDCLYELYKITGKEEHVLAAHKFDEEALFETVANADKGHRKNILNNRHSNTTIPKYVGALNRYRTVGDERYLEYVEIFWNMVVERHTYITGGNGEWEHFGKDFILDGERTNCNCETCASYNMLKISRELFKITKKKKYADYYENTMINSIMASQNPETGMSMYFQPMATGYFKVYGTPFDKFWCCTGSGMENFTKLGDSIYFEEDGRVYVNQYVSSELMLSRAGLKLVQKSEIPEGNCVFFTVEKMEKVENHVESAVLMLRIPDWKAGEVEICMKVNGREHVLHAEPGVDYVEIAEPLCEGMEISMKIPMEVRAYSLPDGQDVYGFRYGPVVLSAELGTEDMQEGVTGVIVTIPMAKKVEKEYITISEPYGGVSDYIDNIAEHMVKLDGEVKFHLQGTDADSLIFGQYYRQHRQRFGIYWYFRMEGDTDSEARMQALKDAEAFENAKLDTVQPGYGQYENDELHNMEEYLSVGDTSDGTTRYAKMGGYFTYRMIVEPEQENFLKVSLRKEDNGKRLHVTAGDAVIYNEVLDYHGEQEEYDVWIRVPEAVVEKYAFSMKANGKDVTVLRFMFEGEKGSESPRLSSFIYTVKG